MSQPNQNPGRKAAADALDLMNTTLKDFQPFKRKPSGEPVPQASPAHAHAHIPNAAAHAHPHMSNAAAPVHAPMAAPAEASHASEEAPAASGIAAVTVDAAGKILAVDNGCTSMFGWKGSELVGQHLKALVKDWPDNYLAKFLQKPGRGESAPLSFRVTGKRMDGREFSVSMTRLNWVANATSKLNAGPAPEYWTALFGELGDITNTPARRQDGGGSGPAARLEDAPHFKGSVSALRSANEELQKKLEAMAVDAWKKGEMVNKIEKDRVELDEKLKATEAELTALRSGIEEEAGALESSIQELTAGKAALEAQLAEQTRHADEAQKLSAQLRQEINSAKLAADRAESARQQEIARADGFKVALTNLQHTYDELNVRLSKEKQTASEATRRLEELESMLRGTSSEAERANAELEKEKAVHARVQADLRAQLTAAKLEAERAEASGKQEAARAEGLKQALANVQRASDDLNARLTAEQVTAGQMKRRLKDLEGAMRETSGDAAARTHVETELRAQLGAAKLENERAQSAYKQELARASRLERELSIVRQELQELDGKLSTELQPALEWRRRAKELENMLRESTGELERVRADRSRLESELRSRPGGSNTVMVRRASEPVDSANPSDLIELERQLRRQVEERFNSLNTQFTELREELRRSLSSQKNTPIRSGEFGPPRPDWDRKVA